MLQQMHEMLLRQIWHVRLASYTSKIQSYD